MVKSTAALFGAAVSVMAANVAFNTPAPWSTLRTGTVNASYIVDSTLIGKQIQLTVVENSNGAEKTVGSQTVTIKALDGTASIPVQSKINGGTSYLSLKWKTADQNGTVAPFAIAPVANAIDPNAVKASSLNGEPSAASMNSAGTPVTVGTGTCSFGWTPSAFALLVKGTGTVSVSIDPDNSKSGFRAFSDRTITVDFAKNSIVYTYTDRFAKNSTVIYRNVPWTGDFKGSVKNGEALVTIPWYDLGAKPFAGRQLGMVIVQGTAKFPASGDENNPSTWGNILLK